MCYSPITIKTPQGYKQVPCGRCLECLRKKQSDWSNRMFEELKSKKGKAVFFTLTYDDKSVPKNYLYYWNAQEVEIFRSPSAYSYDNTIRRERGEKVHPSVLPYIDLQELGIDTTNMIDFNVSRNQSVEFKNKLKDIYANYVNLFTAGVGDAGRPATSVADYNFDRDFVCSDFLDSDESHREYEETECSGQGPDPIIEQAISETICDCDYQGSTTEQEVDELCLDAYKYSNPTFRERPIMMFNSVRKKDVQDWLKRGRKKLSDKPFTYFITAEYGPRTLRPHYHGVLFGVSALESRCMMEDWQKRFGIQVKWDDVDLSKGDMSYCAKYCCKGFYEHPLCSRDFFYPKKRMAPDGTELLPFTEYHSKHYERCLEIFGVDAPIVDKTFILVSKGVGAEWIEKNKGLLDDFTNCDWTQFEFKKPDDIDDVPTIQFGFNKKLTDTINTVDIDQIFSSEFQFTPYTIKPKKSYETKTKDFEECIDRLLRNFNYSRVFKGQTITYSVPKYYRQKMFSDALRCAYSNFISQVNVELYQQKLSELRESYPNGSDYEVVSQLETQDRQERIARMYRVRDKINKIYNKSKL